MIDTHSALAGKRVVITGASSGLGAECAMCFARQGATVVIVARRKHRLNCLKRRLNITGANSFVISADLTQPAVINQIRAMVEKKFGGCDILVNNAGAYLGD